MVGQQLDSVRIQLSALGTNMNALFGELSIDPAVPLQIINPPGGLEPIIIGGFRGGAFFNPTFPPVFVP